MTRLKVFYNGNFTNKVNLKKISLLIARKKYKFHAETHLKWMSSMLIIIWTVKMNGLKRMVKIY
jgi:hypothetical protein